MEKRTNQVVQIEQKSQEGERVISETSFGTIVMINHNGQNYILGMSSKDGKDGSFGIPKGKLEINTDGYIENPEDTAIWEVKEETNTNLNLLKIIDTTDFKSFNEYNEYEPSERNGNIKEKSYKSINLKGKSTIFSNKKTRESIEGKIIKDKIGGKKRLVKLIPITEIEKYFKSEQVDTINKVINELDGSIKLETATERHREDVKERYYQIFGLKKIYDKDLTKLKGLNIGGYELDFIEDKTMKWEDEDDGLGTTNHYYNVYKLTAEKDGKKYNAEIDENGNLVVPEPNRFIRRYYGKRRHYKTIPSQYSKKAKNTD